MPFSNFYILIFLVLLFWLESLSTMLNKLSDSFCLSLVSKLKGKASNILPLRMWTADGFTCYSFIRFLKFIYLLLHWVFAAVHRLSLVPVMAVTL